MWLYDLETVYFSLKSMYINEELYKGKKLSLPLELNEKNELNFKRQSIELISVKKVETA